MLHLIITLFIKFWLCVYLSVSPIGAYIIQQDMPGGMQPTNGSPHDGICYSVGIPLVPDGTEGECVHP